MGKVVRILQINISVKDVIRQMKLNRMDKMNHLNPEEEFIGYEAYCAIPQTERHKIKLGGDFLKRGI